MTDLSDLVPDGREDTARFKALAKIPSDPAAEIPSIVLTLDAHMKRDRVVHTLLAIAATAMLGAAGTMIVSAWSLAEERGRDRERLEQLVRDVARIEGRIERLDERISSRDHRGEE